MSDNFLEGTLGHTGFSVFRLGLSGSKWPGVAALRTGVDAGMNYLFWFYWDRHMTQALREVLPGHRDKYFIATGVGNLGPWLVRRGLEDCLRKLRTDYLDVFHIFWLSAGRLSPRTLDVLRRAKEEGKIRAIAVSTHARRYAGELVRDGKLDVLMMRYNAAHRGAEEEIFPHLPASNPGVVSYTATRWGRLLRRPRGWPESERVPLAGDCYRFVLSNPHVDVCLTCPGNARELSENLAAVARGPLASDEMDLMRRFGDLVHQETKLFGWI
jgi:aryl-alcohol dehydrogenase-like predicted oxidoreductase